MSLYPLETAFRVGDDGTPAAEHPEWTALTGYTQQWGPREYVTRVSYSAHGAVRLALIWAEDFPDYCGCDEESYRSQNVQRL